MPCFFRIFTTGAANMLPLWCHATNLRVRCSTTYFQSLSIKETEAPINPKCFLWWSIHCVLSQTCYWNPGHIKIQKSKISKMLARDLIGFLTFKRSSMAACKSKYTALAEVADHLLLKIFEAGWQ